MNKKTLTSVGIAMTLGMTMVLNGNSANTTNTRAAAGSAPLILYMSGPLTIPLTVAMANGVKAAGKTYGVNAQYETAPTLANYIPDQTTLIKQAIGRHPAALVVCDFFPSAFDPLIKEAVKAGIPTFVCNVGLDSWQPDGALGFVGEVATLSGPIAVKAATQAGMHNVLCVNESPGNPVTTTRCQEIAAGMKAAGGSEALLTEPLTDGSNPAASVADIQGYLSSHPSIDGVITNNAADSPNALLAIKNLGKTGKIKLGTFDDTPETLQDVQNGSMVFNLDEQPYLQGYLPIESAALYIKYGIRPTGPINTGGLIINKSNIASYLANAKANPEIVGAAAG